MTEQSTYKQCPNTALATFQCNNASYASMHHSIAINLNDIGVSLLEEQHGEAATATFRKAVEAMKLAFRPSKTVSKDDFVHHIVGAKAYLAVDHRTISHSPSKAHQGDSNSTKHYQNCMKTALDSEKKTVRTVNIDIDPMVYTRPIKIGGVKNISSVTENRNINNQVLRKDSAIIMYNMALNYHIQGTKLGKQILLNRALKMYEMAYQIIRDQNICFDDEDKTERAKSALHVMMALLNNSALIHRECVRYDMCNELFNSLAEMIDMIPNNNVNCCGIDHFVMNILYFTNSTAAAAA